MVGKIISHYEIIDKLGKGGMGEIYLAHDTTLHRKVALKILPPELASDPERRARFEREAKAVAALNHPNIVTIHSVEEFEGLHFLTLELVEGKTLGELIPKRGMSLPQLLEIALPLVDALGAAHQKGITHRDLKPSNIMVSKEGRVKILDFGLAKLRLGLEGEVPSEAPTEELTAHGRILGTVPYMSPEQVQAKPADHRSDIFSLGVILYEMATARRPFQQDNQAALISAILRDTPDMVADAQLSFPAHLGQVIGRCLEKDPDDRFQSADEIYGELAALKKGIESGEIRPRKPLTGWWIAAGIAVLVIGSGYLLTRWTGQEAGMPPGDAEAVEISDQKKIVVLPFENLGPPGNQYFADGMTEEIISRLSGVHGLGVISRKSALHYAGTDKTVKQIGEELGVEFALAGTVRWAGGSGEASRVRITPQLIRASDDTNLWVEAYDRVLDDVFGVQSEIAEQVIDKLGITLMEAERKNLASIPTKNLEAYQAYLLGRYHVRRADYSVENMNLAVQLFEQAVKLDPDFALAYSELSQAHALIYQLGQDLSEERRLMTQRAAERAVELAPEAAETHLAVGYYHYQVLKDYQAALDEFLIAGERLPNDPVVLEAKGFVFRRQGLWEEGLAALEQALQLNPRDPQLTAELAETYANLRRYREAIDFFNQSIAYAPDQSWAYFSKALTYWLWKGTTEEARATLEAMPRTDDSQAIWLWFWQRVYERNYRETLEWLSSVPDWVRYFEEVSPKSLLAAHTYRFIKETELARQEYQVAVKLLETEVQAWPNDPRVHSALGIAYAGLGRRDDAIREGKRATELRPLSEDAFSGKFVLDLALIHAMLGDADAAVEQLARLLSAPSLVSVPLLQLDPRWDPLRDNPRFQELLYKYR